jgi:phosphoesterase RecJ-like protein
MTKGSLRSSESLDAAAVAETLNGGGHARAAGFRAEGSLEEVRSLLIQKLIAALV